MTREGFNRDAGSPDEDPVLVCANCARAVVFASRGWTHLSDEAACASAVVAWPPAADDDEDAA